MEIHVIVKTVVDPTNLGCVAINHKAGLYSSSAWDVAQWRADALIGGKIYIHTGQKTASIHGGTITAFEKHENGRFTFFYTAELACKGSIVGNWSQEISFG
jgi:hypothetical protein